MTNSVFSNPEMIIFDYGQTLLYEPDFNILTGEKAVFEHVISNPFDITPEEISSFGARIFEKYHAARLNDIEVHEFQGMKLKYDYFNIKLDISFEEAEIILWSNASKGAIIPGVSEMLARLFQKGIRTAVISNIGWSGNALSERLNRLLPENSFEFIIASSDYGIRKPDKLIFELALRLSRLKSDKVWYCGDNIKADVYGAHNAGIFPVHYDNPVDNDSFISTEFVDKPDFEYLRINNWSELTELLI